MGTDKRDFIVCLLHILVMTIYWFLKDAPSVAFWGALLNLQVTLLVGRRLHNAR